MKLYSMESLLNLKDFIGLVVPNPPTPTEWHLMTHCVERLRPLADATEEVESDAATLLTVARS